MSISYPAFAFSLGAGVLSTLLVKTLTSKTNPQTTDHTAKNTQQLSSLIFDNPCSELDENRIAQKNTSKIRVIVPKKDPKSTTLRLNNGEKKSLFSRRFMKTGLASQKVGNIGDKAIQVIQIAKNKRAQQFATRRASEASLPILGAPTINEIKEVISLEKHIRGESSTKSGKLSRTSIEKNFKSLDAKLSKLPSNDAIKILFEEKIASLRNSIA